MRHALIVLLSLTLGIATTCAAEEVAKDPVTGMKIGENWELVRNHCIICHSAQTFLRQRGTETTWTSILEWMQKSGGLWKLHPDVEKAIIGYLTEHYGPEGSFRRAPIPATLMPPNPYASEAKLEVEAKKKAGALPKPPPTQ
jgi:hypothetical protein